MIFLRSIIFNILFYLNLVVFLLLGSVFLLTPRIWSIRALQTWAKSSLWLLRVICDITMEVRGIENIPQQPCLIAGKHQSLWETFAILPLFDDPCMVLKKELTYIPFFGWFCLKFKMIAVERSAGSSALRNLVSRARAELARGRHVIIMPEGTRRIVGDPPDYKPGAAALYTALNIRCIPFGLNSGLHWPRRRFLRTPGKIIIEFGTPIPVGLPRKQFQTSLVTSIEGITTRLINEETT